MEIKPNIPKCDLVRMKQGHQHVFQDTAEQLPLCNRPTTKHNLDLCSESDFENYFLGLNNN